MRIGIFFLLMNAGFLSFSQTADRQVKMEKIRSEIIESMERGDIPGLSLVVIDNGQPQMISFGYADQEKKRPVSSNTLFELGSCSKAFTALAATMLEADHRLSLDHYVSHYIPWFRVMYKDSVVEVTVRQLLHHTSGIPWTTITKIPRSNGKDALELTVKQLVGQDLSNLPGTRYEYATINYDVLALIIETVTHQSFESYVTENVIEKLRLENTAIGYPADSSLKAKGYKVGFFQARAYDAPVFRGNNAAGYVISNAEDVSKWMLFQMGLTDHPAYPLAQRTHQRDETVPLHYMNAYAMGWEISLKGNGEILHTGLNPNFSAYVAFRPRSKTGVAVLANSNSGFTPVIGDKVMRILANERNEERYYADDGNDKFFSIICFILGLYIIVSFVFLLMIFRDILSGHRRYEAFTAEKMRRSASLLIVLAPFSLGVYWLPKAMAGFSWDALVVWSPVSLPVAVALMIASVAISFFTYLICQCFPHRNNLVRTLPRLLLLSVLAGLANMIIIILITSALDAEVKVRYMIFYYVLAFSVYLLGRRHVQISLIKLSRELTFELRTRLMDKIFSTSYQRFEKIDRGRVYTAFNDDVNTIGGSTGMFIVLVTSLITAVAAFFYLATIAFWSTIVTISLVMTISVIYYVVSKKVNAFFEDARDTQNVFLRLINGMIDGFKELSLHYKKKAEYKAEMVQAILRYKDKMSGANIRFVNAFLIGESLLIVLLGLVAFALPELFPSIQSYAIMNFIVILLYLIGPINAVLNAVPSIMQFRIAWNRIQRFLNDIPANMELKPSFQKLESVESLRVNGVQFHYADPNDHSCFTVGPIDFSLKKGEALFVIGGNGSGKTTLGKLLTGLYEPSAGEILLNEKKVTAAELGEYFSAVFSPCFLFEKLYSVDTSNKSEALVKYLHTLDLQDKLTVKENTYSTIKLSGGQKKRMALLQCYLEDSPIYLFDEWAADQDPEYREFFYKTLLPEMKAMGKIIIAITHDDRYFDVADKVLKLDRGTSVEYANKRSFSMAETFDGSLNAKPHKIF